MEITQYAIHRFFHQSEKTTNQHETPYFVHIWDEQVAYLKELNEPSKNSEFLNAFKNLCKFRSFHRIDLFRNHLFHSKIVDFSFQVSIITCNQKNRLKK